MVDGNVVPLTSMVPRVSLRDSGSLRFTVPTMLQTGATVVRSGEKGGALPRHRIDALVYR